MEKDSLDFLNKAAQVIYDKKGFNLLALDVRGLSSLTDYLLIAEGNVDRHVSSIARALRQEFDERPLRMEGLQVGDWVVVDYGDVMIHLFMPGLREKYQLERLWPESRLVELEIDCSAHKLAAGEDEFS